MPPSNVIYDPPANKSSHVVKEKLIGLILADVKFMNECNDIAEYINTLRQARA